MTFNKSFVKSKTVFDKKSFKGLQFKKLTGWISKTKLKLCGELFTERVAGMCIFCGRCVIQ